MISPISPKDTKPTSKSFIAALAYEAPFLIEKLVKEYIVDSAAEAEALFTEVRKYIVMVHIDRTRTWQMHSYRVDEAWHQFILFTREYKQFCKDYFGRYVPHAPSNAPKHEGGAAIPVGTFEEFCARYEQLFGTPLPDAWHDEKSITVTRRVINDTPGQLTVQAANGMSDLLDRDGDLLLSVSALAAQALAFITRTGAFYVRELPGDLTDEEKIALVSTLVAMKLLRAGA